MSKSASTITNNSTKIGRYSSYMHTCDKKSSSVLRNSSLSKTVKIKLQIPMHIDTYQYELGI